MSRPRAPPSLSSVCYALPESDAVLHRDALHVFGVNFMYLFHVRYPLGVRHCAVSYLITINTPTRKVVIIVSIIQMGSWGSEQVNDLPRITQIVRGGNESGLRSVWYQSLFSFPFAEGEPISLIPLWPGRIVYLMWPPHLPTLSAPPINKKRKKDLV